MKERQTHTKRECTEKLVWGLINGRMAFVLGVDLFLKWRWKVGNRNGIP